MNKWRKFIKSNKSVSWLICAAILLLLISPVHIHIHHEVQHDGIHHSGGNGLTPAATHIDSDHDHHKTTLHTATDTAGHDGHEDATPLSIKSDGISKQSGNKLSFFIILTFSLFLVGINSSSALLRPFASKSLSSKHFYISPPLRAPPLH